MQKLLTHARDALEKMPREPSDQPVSEVLEILHKFSRDLEREMDGVADDNGLLQRILPRKEAFRRAIRVTAPDFVPVEKSLDDQYTSSSFSFLNNEETKDDVRTGKDNILSVSKAIYIEEVSDSANK